MMNAMLKFKPRKDLQKGFTLVELMITMVIFVFVIAAISNVFTGLLTQFKQQSKIAETNIEKIVGLEILRQDLETAGYGLPWDVRNGWAALAGYNEAVATGGVALLDPPDASNFNDGAPAAVIGAPRGVVSSNDNGFRGSDYLVIKSVTAAGNNASLRATWIDRNNNIRVWNDVNVDLINSDRIITITRDRIEPFRTLVLSAAGTFSDQFSARNSFLPVEDQRNFLVLGIDPNSTLMMPFNRVDYYISYTDVPARCATGGPLVPPANVWTGVLMKGVLNNSTGAGGGTVGTFQPLLDCVADMQVAYGLDMDEDGTVATFSNPDASAFSTTEGATMATIQATLVDAALLRQRLRELRIYVLAHEGQIDFSYNFVTPVVVPPIPANSIRVGEVINGTNVGRDYPLNNIPNWQNYRWKVYTLVVELNNLIGR